MLQKRGEETVVSNVIMISLSVVIFVFCLVFLSSSAKGEVVYEKAYSKQIALFLDNARPNTQLEIDFGEGIALVEKDLKRKLTNDEKKERGLVQFEDNQVIVSLGKRDFSTHFFTNYDVEYYFDGDTLILNIFGGDENAL